MFSPEAKIRALVRTLILLATTHHWLLHQLDINNVFLHDILHEENIYGATTSVCYSLESEKVCKLKNSLYGLRNIHQGLTWVICITCLVVLTLSCPKGSLSFLYYFYKFEFRLEIIWRKIRERKTKIDEEMSMMIVIVVMGVEMKVAKDRKPRAPIPWENLDYKY